jgi:hypothetical protein
MITTDTAPKHPARELTQAELALEARARFGQDVLHWAYECPICGDIATVREFPPESRLRSGVECIGRYVPGRGCKYTAHGLIPGPWTVTFPEGDSTHCFPLAPAPSQEPQSAPRDPDGIGGPGSADSPSGAPVGAIPAPSSEFLAGPSAPAWLPMDDAPQDGTEIIGLLNGDEVPIRWNDGDRHCAGIGVARGAGYGFGPGWEDTWNNYAVIDEVDGWRPVKPDAESEAC